MRRRAPAAARHLGGRILSVLAAVAVCLLSHTGRDVCGQEKNWEGVDKTVIEKFAAESGRPARDPYINTDRGDLLLFLFLLAGAAGGFIAGYAFRSLFPPTGKQAHTNLNHDRDHASAS